MARIVAVEWDDSEARLAVASIRGAGVVLEQALAVPLADSAAAGEAIAKALGAPGRVTALAAVGRVSIELKRLSLPPAPDDDLPELVRFQALREFNTLADHWPVDYLPLSGSDTEPRQVLAAAIDPKLVEQIQATCAKAHLHPRRIVLRPCAAASLLLRRRGSADTRARLLVDVLGDEADLTVIVAGQVSFLRTARLPGHLLNTPEETKPLLSEIRRTIAAAQNQLAGERVEAIDLCGSSPEHAALAQRMESELGLKVELFDPLAGVEQSRALRHSPLAHPDRFAPLIGMLLDEAEGARHGIDFLNPRQRPAPPSRRKAGWIAAASVAALVLLGVGWVWLELGQLDEDIESLAKRSIEADKPVARAKELVKAADEIEQWTSTEVVWLDELRELAADFPEAKEAMLTELRLQTGPAGGGIHIAGLVRTPGTVDALEAALRDDNHRVTGAGRHADSKPPYGWHFVSDIFVAAATQDVSRPGTSGRAAERVASQGKKATEKESKPPQESKGDDKKDDAKTSAAPAVQETSPSPAAPSAAKEALP